MGSPVDRLEPDVRVEHADPDTGACETEGILEVFREAGFVPGPDGLEDAPTEEHPRAGEVHEQSETLLGVLQALEPEPRLVVVQSGERVRVVVHDTGDSLDDTDLRVIVEVLRDAEE